MTPPPAGAPLPPAARTPVPGMPAAPAPVAAAPVAPVAPVASAAAPAAASSGSPDADLDKATRSFANQDYQAALEQFSAYLQRYPNSENAGNAEFWKAKSLLGLQQYPEAIDEFEKLRSTYPTSNKVPYSLHQQALCHSRLGQTERAKALLDEVIKEYPTHPAAEQAKKDLKRLPEKQ
jgi:tol-pal system protein YbgF